MWGKKTQKNGNQVKFLKRLGKNKVYGEPEGNSPKVLLPGGKGDPRENHHQVKNRVKKNWEAQKTKLLLGGKPQKSGRGRKRKKLKLVYTGGKEADP